MDPLVIRTAIHFYFRLHCSNHGMRSGDVHLGYGYVKELSGVNSIFIGYGEKEALCPACFCDMVGMWDVVWEVF